MFIQEAETCKRSKYAETKIALCGIPNKLDIPSTLVELAGNWGSLVIARLDGS